MVKTARTICLQSAAFWTLFNLVQKWETRYGSTDEQRQVARSVMGLTEDSAFTGCMKGERASVDQARASALGRPPLAGEALDR